MSTLCVLCLCTQSVHYTYLLAMAIQWLNLQLYAMHTYSLLYLPSLLCLYTHILSLFCLYLVFYISTITVSLGTQSVLLAQHAFLLSAKLTSCVYAKSATYAYLYIVYLLCHLEAKFQQYQIDSITLYLQHKCYCSTTFSFIKPKTLLILNKCLIKLYQNKSVEKISKS